MKYLLAFALIAFASAELDSLRLLQPVQIAQPTVDSVKIVDAPVEANDAPVYAVNVVDAIPEVADTPVENDFTVRFVDSVAEAPVANDVAVNIDDAVPEIVEAPVANGVAVNIVDAVPEIVEAPVANDVAVNIVDAVPEAPVANDVAVNIVDAVPEIADAPVEDFAVKFVDNADADEETPSYIPDALFQVKIVQIPLPESVVMPLDGFVVPEPVRIADAVDTNADASVNFVDVAEDTPVFMPSKQYPDPRWR